VSECLFCGLFSFDVFAVDDFDACGVVLFVVVDVAGVFDVLDDVQGDVFDEGELGGGGCT
jgi:hypothetical protein